MNPITTTDLSKFGKRELKITETLLRAWREQGLPKDFMDDAVTVMMNTDSGCVFLTNSEYQAAMMNDDKLESFYSCPQCGHQGFLEEMEHDGNRDCKRYLKEIRGVQPCTKS